MRVRSGRDGDRQESGERRNTSAQQTSGLQQWVDQSPKVRAQEQLIQRTVPTHPPAAGDHSTDPTPHSKLVPNRLNIVGENHPESDARRSVEKAYNQSVLSNSNYWQEGEFTFSDDSGQSLSGDPPYLRFYSSICLLENFAEIDHLPSSDERLAITIKANKNLRSLGVVEYELHRALHSRDIYSNNKDDFDDHFQIAKRITSHLRSVFVDLQKVKVILNDLDSREGKGEAGGAEADEFLDQLNTAFADINSMVEVALEEFENPDLDPFENLVAIARMRSFAMAHAASLPSAPREGVWKVGQSHVDDMREIPNTTFNLIDMADYNIELAQFAKLIVLLARSMAHAGGAPGSMGATEPPP